MALTPVEQVRFLIGLGPSSPFNDFVTNQEIEWALEYTNGNVLQAARIVAIALSLQLSGVSSRERVGDIDVWNNVSTAYTKALDNFINDNSPVTLPNGMMPWAGGISWSDICANNSNPDNVRPKLTQIKTCDSDDKCNSCGCSFLEPCACGCQV